MLTSCSMQLLWLGTIKQVFLVHVQNRTLKLDNM